MIGNKYLFVCENLPKHFVLSSDIMNKGLFVIDEIYIGKPNRINYSRVKIDRFSAVSVSEGESRVFSMVIVILYDSYIILDMVYAYSGIKKWQMYS